MHNLLLKDKTVAILVDNGFEETEMTYPRQAVEALGARTRLISPRSQIVKSWMHINWGQDFKVDLPLQQADAAFDALILPGGVISADRLRDNPAALELVRRFFNMGKPVAAICHAPWLFINAGVVSGLTLTSYPALKLDFINAGATWLDQDVVVDEAVVTSRDRADLPDFVSKLIEMIAKGSRR